MFAALINGMCLSEATAIHDGDAVTDTEEFGQVAADEKDGFAPLSELINEVIDI